MKKVLVVSDTHGAEQCLRRILRAEQDADAMIFLGDGDHDLRVVDEEFPGLPVYAVRGNCDMGSYQPVDGMVAFEKVLIYYTHGHMYGVKYSTDELEQAARDRQAEVALFGHTHRPILKNCPGVQLFNPGSAGQSYSGHDCYGVMLLNDGKVEFMHKEVPAE